MTPPPPPPAPKANLSVSLTDSADPVVLGNTVEYRYAVQNAGPAAATGVMVSTTLPADATADAATGCTADAGVVTCSLGDVPSGGTAAGTLVVRYASTGSKSVTSVVGSAVEDSDPGEQHRHLSPPRSTRSPRPPAPTSRSPSTARPPRPSSPASAYADHGAKRRPAGRRRGVAGLRHRRGVERDRPPCRLHAELRSRPPTLTCNLGSLASGATVEQGPRRELGGGRRPHGEGDGQLDHRRPDGRQQQRDRAHLGQLARQHHRRALDLVRPQAVSASSDSPEERG